MLAIRLPRPFDAAPVAEIPVETKRNVPEEVLMWRCPECRELYEDEDDAEDCCPADEGRDDLASVAHAQCPLCGTEYETHESAVDCCMWLTHGPAERWDLARQLRTYGYLLESALANAVVEQDGVLL